jgi:hypothetical protein
MKLRVRNLLINRVDALSVAPLIREHDQHER